MPATPLEARENEAMMLEAESCPPHVLVMDTGKAGVTGDGMLENIPRLWKAESVTSPEVPALGRTCSDAHMLSATIALLELAGKDVVRTTPEAAVLVVDVPGWPDWVMLYQDAASDIR
jgi:hypothetical protein